MYTLEKSKTTVNSYNKHQRFYNIIDNVFEHMGETEIDKLNKTQIGNNEHNGAIAWRMDSKRITKSTQSILLFQHKNG